jgi:hypothetical protein
MHSSPDRGKQQLLVSGDAEFVPAPVAPFKLAVVEDTSNVMVKFPPVVTTPPAATSGLDYSTNTLEPIMFTGRLSLINKMTRQ